MFSTSAWPVVVLGSILQPVRHFIVGVQTWLSTLEALYRLRGVVAQWLERRFETWARSFTPHYLCLSDETLWYKPLVFLSVLDSTFQPREGQICKPLKREEIMQN